MPTSSAPGNPPPSATTSASSASGSDLEKLPLPDVISNLQTDLDKGLSSSIAQSRLQQYGPNALAEHHVSMAAQVISYFTGSMAYIIEGSALISAVLGRWPDFFIILGVLFFNAGLEFWQDRKAAGALAALKKSLAPDATVLRDGQWASLPAANLVPGDIVKIRLGMVVPADLRLSKGDYAAIDQAALTGESLPATKKVGDSAYSGSVVKQGEMEGVVISTGSHTFFGRTANLVASAGTVSHAQKAMLEITNFLIILAVALSTFLAGLQIYQDVFVEHSWSLHAGLNILQFVLVLLVAAVPVTTPAVFSITMALGALALSKEKAIVSRLSAIEEMAGVDILCSDKTGTLTKNQLSLSDPVLFEAKDAQECLVAAALASRAEDKDAIDLAVISGVKDTTQLKQYSVQKFLPFDPVTKRTAAVVNGPQGKTLSVTKGAPLVIAELVKPAPDVQQKIAQTVQDFAGKGFRTLGVALSDDGEKTWKLLGIIPMFDPPRDDSKATIEKANAKGVRVKMITGDDTAIAIETARQLGMGTRILTASDVFPTGMDPNQVPAALADTIEQADGFARVFPEHKYAIVKSLQAHGHIVAMTGDGVNDAPALKQADCGTAVSGATDAARAAAALILTAPGLSVINSAIDEARRIFARISSYMVYRVALTLDIIFLVVLSLLCFKFTPLTAIMIVVMSLLDDLPIMTIAYDRVPVSTQPERWEINKLLKISSLFGFFSTLQSFAFLAFGYMGLQDPDFLSTFGYSSAAQLQTGIFLQLIAGGHLLLFVTRKSGWFFTPPYPSPILFWAIMGTQVFAILMCGLGWLVEPISWKFIAWTWAYNLLWMVFLSGVSVMYELFESHRARHHAKSIQLVNQRLN